jgi:UDP-glucuronate 4-epimerase
MSESILVTGGGGFIGSHLVDNLLDEGHRVTVLDNFNDFYDPALKRKNCRAHRDYDTYRLVEGDIRDADVIDVCLSGGEFGEVIHLAAMAGVRPSIENPTLYQEVNLIGTMNLLEACRRYSVNRFIFASSSSVYGNNERVPFSEEDRADNPISPYASTKKSGELMVYTYHHLFGIKAACLRLFTVYGPRQRPEMAICLFTDSMHHDREILRFGDGSTRRDYTYVDDIVAGILACRKAEFDYEIINLGRSDTISLSDLIAKLEKLLGKKAKVTIMPDQAGDVRQTYAEITKAKRLLDFTPRVSIEQGLDKFVTWYLSQQRDKL